MPFGKWLRKKFGKGQPEKPAGTPNGTHSNGTRDLGGLLGSKGGGMQLGGGKIPAKKKPALSPEEESALRKRTEARKAAARKEEAVKAKQFAEALQRNTAKAEDQLKIESGKFSQRCAAMGLGPRATFKTARDILFDSDAPGLAAIRARLNEIIAERTVIAPEGSERLVDLVVRRLEVEALNEAFARGLITKRKIEGYKPPPKSK